MKVIRFNQSQKIISPQKKESALKDVKAYANITLSDGRKIKVAIMHKDNPVALVRRLAGE